MDIDYFYQIKFISFNKLKNISMQRNLNIILITLIIKKYCLFYIIILFNILIIYIGQNKYKTDNV